MERDQIARQLDGGITADQEALIVREPQLRSARAQVEAARAAVTQAQLDLQRTRVVAPFRALVLERTVHPGSRVGPGTDLGRLVGVDRFFVELTVPAARLRHLATPADGEATTVELVDRASWTREQVRTGKLQSVLGQVDDQTRLARVLVAVRDPLALDPSTQGPPLMAGAWVEATLEARVLEDVVRIDRAWLRRHRGEDAVWEMVEGRLKIREVEVLLQDEAHAYLSAGLAPDAQIVTTDLSTVTDDAPLRIANGSP